jgi:uncharacterized protein (TIGR02594 family)
MPNANVLKVQKRLKELGYQVGPIDGIRGRKVITAVKQFQHNNGLVADGLVGRNTYAAMFAQPNQAVLQPVIDFDATPWMESAYSVMGLHESRNKSRLMRWLASDGDALGDIEKNPWCGDFVQTAIALTMPEEPIPTNPYLALNWAKFGIPVKPTYGAVLSMWRGSPDSWKGHVAFAIGVNESGTAYRIVGGNQKNRVSETWIASNRVRKNGCRWPSTALPPKGDLPVMNSKGAVLSTNEA